MWGNWFLSCASIVSHMNVWLLYAALYTILMTQVVSEMYNTWYVLCSFYEQEEGANIVVKFERAQAERSYLEYELVTYPKEIDTLWQQSKREISDHQANQGSVRPFQNRTSCFHFTILTVW
jgi:hypothetical protein